MNPTIEEMLINETASIKDAIVVIDKNAQGICFVVDTSGKLTGTLTDGDIRRAILNETPLSASVDTIKYTNYTAFPVEVDQKTIIAKLTPKVRHIPLIDKDGIPVDYVSARRYRRIPIMEPLLAGNELAYVSECVKTNWISSQGKFVRSFEEMLGKFHDMPYALAVSNGTVAIHLALVALGVGEGDEVIVPNYTFAASINAVLHANATPVIVDIEPNSWNIDPEAMEAAITPKTKAIMPVHLYGYPAEMKKIMAIAERHNLIVVEDNAEALGSQYYGQLTGTFGHAATYSFFGNKTVTTGEGGLILFREKEHYEKAVTLRDHGMSRTRKYWHELVGYNYRMTNLQAAIGVAQMERIDEILEMKTRMANVYNENLKGIPGIILPPEHPDHYNTHWLYTIEVDEKIVNLSRDQIISKLLQNGIEARPTFFPLHEMPPYQAFGKGDYPNSVRVSRNGFSLPSFVHLKESTQLEICSALKSIIKVDKLMGIN